MAQYGTIPMKDLVSNQGDEDDEGIIIKIESTPINILKNDIKPSKKNSNATDFLVPPVLTIPRTPSMNSVEDGLTEHKQTSHSKHVDEEKQLVVPNVESARFSVNDSEIFANGTNQESTDDNKGESARYLDLFLSKLPFTGHKAAIKITILSFLGIIAAFTFIYRQEAEYDTSLFSVKNGFPFKEDISKQIESNYFYFSLTGALATKNDSTQVSSDTLTVYNCRVKKGKNFTTCSHLKPEDVHLVKRFYVTEDNQLQTYEETVHFDSFYIEEDSYYLYIETSSPKFLGIMLRMSQVTEIASIGIWSAAIILIFLYSLIITELIHRTTAAMLASLLALAMLSLLDKGPSLMEVITWIDWETLMLLFGMMLLVAIFAESGFFDWSAVMAYKLAKGKEWRLVFLLCIFAGTISAFLDNVTTILLMTPVTIKLCEVLNMDAKWVLIAEVVMSNIGGTATAIGDPPNVLIVANPQVQDMGVDFMEFTTHLSFGSILAMVVGLATIRLLYRNKSLFHADDPEIRQLRKEIHMWKKTAKRIPSVSREENAVKSMLYDHVRNLEKHLNRKMLNTANKRHNWKDNLADLRKHYIIKDKILLAKSGAVLFCVVILFFIQSTSIVNTDLGWIAVLGALLLVILADVEDIEEVLHKVEWATLMFFAALFVLMEALEKLGLIDFIGEQTEELINQIPESSRFAMAIIIILWVSALVSSFIDNIPFTSAMIPVIIKLSENFDEGQDRPLLWALAFGACLGGNGTLIGASANVVCAGVAEQRGIKISFVDYFKVGFPTMLITVFVVMIYLLFCHYVFQWH